MIVLFEKSQRSELVFGFGKKGFEIRSRIHFGAVTRNGFFGSPRSVFIRKTYHIGNDVRHFARIEREEFAYLRGCFVSSRFEVMLGDFQRYGSDFLIRSLNDSVVRRGNPCAPVPRAAVLTAVSFFIVACGVAVYKGGRRNVFIVYAVFDADSPSEGVVSYASVIFARSFVVISITIVDKLTDFLHESLVERGLFGNGDYVAGEAHARHIARVFVDGVVRNGKGISFPPVRSVDFLIFFSVRVCVDLSGRRNRSRIPLNAYLSVSSSLIVGKLLREPTRIYEFFVADVSEIIEVRLERTVRRGKRNLAVRTTGTLPHISGIQVSSVPSEFLPPAVVNP